MQRVFAEPRRVGAFLVPATLAILALGAAFVGAAITGTTAGAVTQGVESAVVSSSSLLSDLSALLPLGFAFGAGMVSAVNPCGFAMLPAYLGLYLGTGGADASRSVASRLGQATIVGFTVTMGFVLLFGVAGVVVNAGSRSIAAQYFPWLGLSVGILLVVAGAWIVSGGTLYSGLAERLSAGIGNTQQRSLRGYFAFGLGYGLASLSCTLPIFLTVVGSTLTLDTLLSSASQFLLYALGMGLVILALTLSMAVFRGALVGKMRAALPYTQPVSAVLLLAAGGYIVYYWLTLGELLDTFM